MAAVATATYLLLGVAAALVVRARGAAGLALILLWPFLLPVRLLAERPGGEPDPARGALAGARAALLALKDPPETCGRVLSDLEASLSRRARRRSELATAVLTAPVTVQERLRSLLAVEEAELEAGRQAAEELSAQLTLLRFAGQDTEDDRGTKEAVEQLLARIEAQVALG